MKLLMGLLILVSLTLPEKANARGRYATDGYRHRRHHHDDAESGRSLRSRHDKSATGLTQQASIPYARITGTYILNTYSGRKPVSDWVQDRCEYLTLTVK